MKRAAPKFKPDELPETEREFLAWISAVNERGEPRYGVTEMPARGFQMAYDLLYDIIRSARLAHSLVSAMESVSEAERREAEARLAEAATPAELGHRLQQAFDSVLGKAQNIVVQRRTRGYTINNVYHGETLLQAIEKCAMRDKSAPG